MNGFLGSAILEAAMGAAFVYLMLAVFCTTVNEWIAGLLSARANTLRTAILGLLSDQNLAAGEAFLDAFYGHPIVASLMTPDRHPSYLPARSFSTAVIDLATANVRGTLAFADLENGIRSLPDGAVKTSLLALIQNAEGDLARAQSNIESWFNNAMSRASEWYRRRTQLWIVLIAVAITITTNADTVAMLRQFHGGSTPQGQLPGWNAADFHAGVWGWFSRVTGWCLTVAAVSLGAPFWFDLLNRFVNLRNAGRPVA